MLGVTPSVTLSPRPDWTIRLAAQLHVAEWDGGRRAHTHVFFLSTVVDL